MRPVVVIGVDGREGRTPCRSAGFCELTANRYTVARRTNEIGIRVALGATPNDVTWLILRDALATVITGLILGVPRAIWGRSLAATLIQNLPMQTATPFALATIGIVGVAVLASYVPVRRAPSVDPLEAVRHE